MLTLRRTMLAPLGVTHIVVQANRTHSGEPKDLYHDDNPNTIWVNVEDMPDTPDEGKTIEWTRENFQRNAILRGLRGNVSPGDILLITDADEIIRPEAIARFTPEMGMAGLQLDSFMYYLNCLAGRQNWKPPRILTAEYLVDKTPQSVRDEGYPYVIEDAGFHFSYLGGVDRIRRKIQNFAHQELNTPTLHADLERKIKNKEVLWAGDELPLVPIDDYYPKEITENLPYYQHLIA